MDTSARRETNKNKLSTFFNSITMFVVYHYFESCVLKEYMFSLHFFLNKNLHRFFHFYLPSKSCCKCSKSDDTSNDNRQVMLEKHDFDRLFTRDDSIASEHEVTENNRIKLYCLCSYSANSKTEICDLDITVLYKIMSTCFEFPPTPGNPYWVRDIKETRNYLSHCGNKVSEEIFVKYLERLEHATCNIAKVVSKMYYRDIQHRIEDIKMKFSIKNDVLNAVQMCNADLENNILKALDQMECKVADKLLFHLGQPTFNQPNTATDEEADILQDGDGEKCLIYWTFKPQGEWDVNEVAEKLKHISALLDFKIIFVYAGSLVVKTSTNMRLLTNADEFYKAIGTFFEQFVVQCELDTSMKESFDVSIEIFYLPMKERNDYMEACKRCREKNAIVVKKEEEVIRLKQEMNKQLKRSYSSLMCDVESISRSVSKDFNIENSLDQFLATYDDDDLWKEINISSPESESHTKGKSKVEQLEKPSAETHEIKVVDIVTDSGLLDDGTASENKSSPTTDKVQKSTTIEKEAKPMFIKLNNLESEFKDPTTDERQTINNLAVTYTDHLVVTYLGSKDVNIFSDTGDFLNNCVLEEIPWDVCVCPPSLTLDKSDSEPHPDVIFTLPESESYQHVLIENNAIVPKQSIFVGMFCPGVAVHKHAIFIGGLQIVYIYNREDEFIRFVNMDTSVLRMAVITKTEDQPQMLLNEFPFTETQLVILNTENGIHEEKNMKVPSSPVQCSKYLSKISNYWFSAQNDKLIKDNIYDIKIDQTSGSRLILSNSSSCIYSVSSDGTIEYILNKDDEMFEPTAFCIDEDFNKIFVGNDSGRILVYVRRK